MWPQQESNLYQKFRKLLFYPLNYGTWILGAKIVFFKKFIAKIWYKDSFSNLMQTRR